MRAIGFSRLSERPALNRLIGECIQRPTNNSYIKTGDGHVIGEFDREFADGVGLAVCGEFDRESRFVYEYYYPYLRGSQISSEEDVTVYRQAAREAYLGICDDYRVGVSIIFYLQNMMQYIRIQGEDVFPVRGTTLTLSALSVSGTILMPIYKSAEDLDYIRKRAADRSALITEARNGDEAAIESLTMEDMDNFSVVSRRIRNEDIFSLVDNYFMPYGVESDLYSILGEIVTVSHIMNQLTEEKLYVMLISCNSLMFEVCINEADLLGMPEEGRRFKGNIWMQGYVNFPEN